MARTIILFSFFICLSCNLSSTQEKTVENVLNEIKQPTNSYRTIQEIPPPDGYTRRQTDQSSFENWLCNLPLKSNKTVYLYDGTPKSNQAAQFAVLDIDRSKTDLQQCADVVMRLRAEYLFSRQQYDSIRFMDFNNKWYNWNAGNNRQAFDRYLKEVFSWCGSASLEKQLKPVNDFKEIKPGDVFIKGGFPGHAVIVADMAINTKGEKIFMLVQGYQPAQDIHLLTNPMDSALNPWYSIPEVNEIITPEWRFNKQQLKTW